MSGQQSTSSGKTIQRKAGVSAIPQGYHAVTPYLVVNGAAKLIEFMRKAFDAKEEDKMLAPDGKIGHAALQIGDSHLMISDTMQGMEPHTAMLYLYVADADATFKRAVAAGAKSVKEPADQFYGDRSGCVTDFAGNTWWISTHIEDVPSDELQRRSQEAMKKMQKH